VDAAPQIIRVELPQRGYDIEIGTGTLSGLGQFVARRLRLSRAVVITDAHVESPHADVAAGSLADAGAGVDLVVLEPGEPSKSVDVVAELWQKMLELEADRQTIVVAVGGGVVGDIAGFVAAGYARGVPLVQVPTTLLAQVDSSVGGKVGVNLPGAKNKVGAFWQPRGVLVDTSTLSTLPDRDYRAGLAEVVKYGVILDEEFFAWLEQHVHQVNARDPVALRYLVAQSCRLKAQIVCEDEREETGRRAVLNYGHTFAHALESVAGYGTLLHGEAVAIGMVLAARLAQRLGRIEATVTQRQHELLAAFELGVDPPPLDPQALVDAMSHDKKVEHGRLRFVLPDRLGNVKLVDGVSLDDVAAVLGE